MNLISTDLNQYLILIYFRLHRYFRTFSIFLLDAQAQSQIDDNFRFSLAIGHVSWGCKTLIWSNYVILKGVGEGGQ